MGNWHKEAKPLFEVTASKSGAGKQVQAVCVRISWICPASSADVGEKPLVMQFFLAASPLRSREVWLLVGSSPSVAKKP